MGEKKLSRRERRMKPTQKPAIPSLHLKEIRPLNRTQGQVFDEFAADQHLFLHGVAGSGKTFVALYLALSEVLSQLTVYNKVIIVRSAVATRDIGFLPGSAKDKIKEFETPYSVICSDLFGRGDAYQILKSKHMIDFMSTSFVRGTTFEDCIVILDEIQNYSWHEIYSTLTRIGRNCRLICSGDFRQTDLDTNKERSGIQKLITIAKRMRQFSFIEFKVEDIVRSKFCKDFIIECYRYDDDQQTIQRPWKTNGHGPYHADALSVSAPLRDG